VGTHTTVAEALRAGRAALACAASAVRDDTPELDAEVLLRHVLGWSRAALFTHPDRALAPADWETFRALLRRRAEGEPVAYLTGRREFMGLDFAVDRRVLIPRPETEAVVQRALAWLAARGGPAEASPEAAVAADAVAADAVAADAVAADVGTGSGAIAITLAAHCPNLRLYATDASAAALEVARANAARLLGPDGLRVTLLRCDLLDGVDEPLDLIAANLPYVPTAELPGLQLPVRGFEPHQALEGGGDGLDLYRRLLIQAQTRLAAGGALLMECDARQAQALQSLARTAFPGAHVEVYPDLAGWPRVVEVRL
jgi:release factor glutamine methyltransferase